jgi:hypothetical protein
MGRIADTFARRLRFSPEDGIAEDGTRTVAGKSQTRKKSCQGRATQNATNATESLTA